MGQTYRRIEHQKPWPGLALDQNFDKVRRVETKNYKVKTSKLGDVLSKVV